MTHDADTTRLLSTFSTKAGQTGHSLIDLIFISVQENDIGLVASEVKYHYDWQIPFHNGRELVNQPSVQSPSLVNMMKHDVLMTIGNI